MMFIQKLVKTIKIIIRGGLIVINDGFICLPVKKRQVIFESFNGKEINDNPAAIYRELVKHQQFSKKNLYFGIKAREFNRVQTEHPDVQLVKRFSLKWIWITARSEFWVFNSRMPIWWKKNKRTTYIQTWHGTPLKKLGVDIEDVNIPGTTTEKYKRNFLQETSRWDYLIAPNDYSRQIFKRAFGFNNQFMTVGYPRNDRLYHASEQDIQVIKNKLVGQTNKRVITYAPTWRDDDFIKTGQYHFELPFDLAKFFERVGNDFILVIRPHYLVKDLIDITGFENRVKILADEDISDIYLISDLLITDYSSVMFDFANLKRPMLFYAYDLKHYRDQLRGFYFDYVAEAPGPLATNVQTFYEELDNFRKNRGFPEYQEKLNAFNEKFCGFEDGHAAENVVKNMMEEIKNE